MTRERVFFMACRKERRSGGDARLLLQFEPLLADAGDLTVVGDVAAIAGGGVGFSDGLQLRLAGGDTLTEALAKLVGRLIAVARIAATGGPAQQQAVNLADAARGRLTLQRLHARFLRLDLFSREETPQQRQQQRPDLRPEKRP